MRILFSETNGFRSFTAHWRRRLLVWIFILLVLAVPIFISKFKFSWTLPFPYWHLHCVQSHRSHAASGRSHAQCKKEFFVCLLCLRLLWSMRGNWINSLKITQMNCNFPPKITYFCWQINTEKSNAKDRTEQTSNNAMMLMLFSGTEFSYLS